MATAATPINVPPDKNNPSNPPDTLNPTPVIVPIVANATSETPALEARAKISSL